MRRRTTLKVDEALLSQAQQALGTEGLEDTVDKALREALQRFSRKRLAERIATGRGIDRSPKLLTDSRPAR